ncbi:MAG: hypothetical protein WBV74_06760 [Pseudonocardiaceae bacterium]
MPRLTEGVERSNLLLCHAGDGPQAFALVRTSGRTARPLTSTISRQIFVAALLTVGCGFTTCDIPMPPGSSRMVPVNTVQRVMGYE